MSIAYLNTSPIKTAINTRVDIPSERMDPKAVAEASNASAIKVTGSSNRCQNSWLCARAFNPSSVK